MKKIILAALVLFSLQFGANAQIPPYGMLIYQGDVGGTFYWGRLLVPSSPTGNYMLVYDGATSQPKLGAMGSSLSWNGSSLDIGSVSQAQVSGLTASLAGKYDAPTGTTAQYIRGDGSLAAFTESPFNYGDPLPRTLAFATAYQANDPSKAADISISPQCTNATTVLAASACTLQVRYGPSGLTCSNGTVVKTWTSTYALGLLLTNTSGSPIDIKVGVGRYFILCPTTGTFSLSTAVDQVAS